ncbi:thioredoxin, partial [Kipferlia bialata]|eukprot:g6489.t1
MQHVRMVTGIAQWQDLQTHDTSVLVEFWASWCGPSVLLSDLVTSIAASVPQNEMLFARVDVDDAANSDIVQQMNVESLPHVCVLGVREGRRGVLAEKNAPSPSDIKAILGNLLTSPAYEAVVPVVDVVDHSMAMFDTEREGGGVGTDTGGGGLHGTSGGVGRQGMSGS